MLLQMINLEKQVASESVDEDFLNISTLIDSDHEMEEEEEERNQRQQAKKIVEVDNVIVEKEEILKKLLDTVRGYSAMKVFVPSFLSVCISAYTQSILGDAVKQIKRYFVFFMSCVVFTLVSVDEALITVHIKSNFYRF